MASVARYAIFVDAGYLLAAGAELRCGVKTRAAVQCDYAALVDALKARTSEHCGQMPLLRVYWYDAANQAVPTLEQLSVAELPDVKLRLGRLTGGKQKGVDSMIVRDLMVLARQRAIATAYLLGGDEDLREGVVAAQDEGVRVLNIGVPGRHDNQARTLLRESDGILPTDAAFWEAFFTPVSVSTVTAAAGVKAEEKARAAATEFAQAWREKAAPEDLQHLLASRPVIPKILDMQLIRTVEERTGSLRERDDLKRAVRGVFWDTVS
jgi:uncharacterized LabA/DUF88 family protein